MDRNTELMRDKKLIKIASRDAAFYEKLERIRGVGYDGEDNPLIRDYFIINDSFRFIRSSFADGGVRGLLFFGVSVLLYNLGRFFLTSPSFMGYRKIARVARS